MCYIYELSLTKIGSVAIDKKENVILIGECKYWSNCVDIDVFYDLIDRSKAVVWDGDDRKEIFVLFSITFISALIS